MNEDMNEGIADDMIAGIYRKDGPTERLRGERALLRERTGGRGDVCVAQFDNLVLPESDGWHEFQWDNFVIDRAPIQE